MKRHATNSMLGTLRTCPQLYRWKYIERLEPIQRSFVTSWGTAFHAMMEAFWCDESVGDALTNWIDSELKRARKLGAEVEKEIGFSQDAMIKEASDQILKIAKEASEVWNYHASFFREERAVSEPLAIEKTFDVPLLQRNGNRHPVWRLRGKWDLVLRVGSQVILRDLKTTTRKPAEYALISELDSQPVAYTFAARYLALDTDFPRPDFFEHYIVRRKAPSAPKILKSGGVSKVIPDSTEKKFREVLEANGINPEDYPGHLEALQGRESRFLLRRGFSVTTEQITRWLEETRRLLRLATAIERNPDGFWRASPWTCQNQYGRRCQYHSLCWGDEKFARSQYVERKTLHQELEEED